jgi:hypothetical protein
LYPTNEKYFYVVIPLSVFFMDVALTSWMIFYYLEILTMLWLRCFLERSKFGKVWINVWMLVI